MHTVTVTPDEVKKIGKLAKINLQENEVNLFAKQFTETLEVVNRLNEIDTNNTEATYQVSGLSNVTRPDEINETEILPKEIALAQAKNVHNGYFVVDRLIDSDAEELI